MPLTMPHDDDRSSDTERFMRLFIAHERRMRGFILALVPDWTDAQDILQEASAVMWRKFDQFQPGTDFAAWALAICRFQVMDYRKRRMARAGRFSSGLVEALADQIASRQPELDARHEALRACLAKLPDRQRRLIRWRYEEGATTRSVAQRIDRSIDAVYKSLNKIHQSLLDCVRRTMAAEGYKP
jgi:RNA polymerase sigma-70 factor (ECF subfamily)